jgi:hypothetical protein
VVALAPSLAGIHLVAPQLSQVTLRVHEHLMDSDLFPGRASITKYSLIQKEGLF